MHYKKLLEAHKAFYLLPGAYDYDNYMKSKDWKSWMNPILPIVEVIKLFDFVRKWDYHFKGDPEVFKKIYEEIYPILKELEHEKIEDADLTDEELKTKIRDVFDKVANCTLIGRYESTDASKILATVNPNFFVMWDNKIKEGMLGGRRNGATYAFYFLPKVQRELEEAIKTCMDEKNLSRTEAVKHIREQCEGKTLAKLADEYNYMKYTKRHPSLWLPPKDVPPKDITERLIWLLNKQRETINNEFSRLREAASNINTSEVKFLKTNKEHLSFLDETMYTIEHTDIDKEVFLDFVEYRNLIGDLIQILKSKINANFEYVDALDRVLQWARKKTA